jgi:hypothetical protein
MPSFEIDFIGHACLKITVGGLRLLTDPWLDGPAYTRQWYPYPLPDRSVPIDDVQYIQYSHGHEDHLHAGTFPLLPKRATVLLTKQWFPSNAGWLRSEGFENVREIRSGQWIELTDASGKDSVRSVSLVNRSDSLNILLTESEALVNVNDALHSYDDQCIDYYCRRLQSLLKGRPIDYLFCGFGGASYFPNCLRHERKDDREVAAAREQHLAKGFARVVRNLQPRMAFAFAAGLVLLEPFNRWINEFKFSNDPVSAVTRQDPSARGKVFKLSPGDRITAGRLERKSVYRTAREHIAQYQRVYADEIRIKNRRPLLSETAAGVVLKNIEDQFQSRLRRVRSRTLDFDWAIRLRDCPRAMLRVTHREGCFVASRLTPAELDSVRDMVVEANSDVLTAGVESMWGGDSLQIGYGAIFHLGSDASVSENHSRQFLRLATQLPVQSDYLRLSPARGLDHLLHSPYLVREAMRIVSSKAQRQSLDSSAGRSDIMEAERWIAAPKCAGCPVCDIAVEETACKAR